MVKGVSAAPEELRVCADQTISSSEFRVVVDLVPEAAVDDRCFSGG
jgi:hypothetical protein